MRFFELPLLWLVNAVMSLVVALSILLVAGWRPNILTGDLQGIGMYWLPTWLASSFIATVWYGFRRNKLRWSYLEGLGWGVLVFVLGAGGLISVMLAGSGTALRRLENLIGIVGLVTLVCLPALLLIAPFTVRLWVWVLRRARGGG